MRITSLAWGCFMAYALTGAAYAKDKTNEVPTHQPLVVAERPLVGADVAQADKTANDGVDDTVVESIQKPLDPVTASPTTLTDDKQALFYQCAKIIDNGGRLACFDAIHTDGQASGVGEKRSLDLSETIISTIKGTPQVVLTDGKPKEVENTQTKLVQEKTSQKTATQEKLADVKTNETPASEVVLDEKPAQKSFQTRLKEALSFKDKNIFQDQLESTSNDSKVLTELGLSDEALSRYTPLSLSFDLDKNSERGLWSARPHNANYFLPFYLHGKPNRTPTTPTRGTEVFSEDQMRDVELKFQLSLKTKAMENVFGTNADLWLGYTQVSHWQVYNENNSRPFRAHDYEPEMFLTQPVSGELPFGGKLRMLGVGGVHHSNGETDPLSRSWNRLYLMGGAEWGKLTVVPRMWTKLSKKEGIKPEDNPDIVDYYGYGDVKFLYQLGKGKNVSGLFRFNPATKKGAVQLDYVYPLKRGISGYLQLFHGYGQSLVDYNHEATSIGVGVMLTDWMGL